MATAANLLSSLSSLSRDVANWVDSVATLTQPAQIHWCDGSAAEVRNLTAELERKGELKVLNQKEFPGCHLARSNPSDVARVEHLTFICTQSKEDAGPNNNWLDPKAAHSKMRDLFAGCMKGRTLYVVPYCMGPIDSPYARCGVEITDSAYVVLNMAIMTRMGRPALERIARDGKFVRGLHSTGELDPNRRFIMHYPEELVLRIPVHRQVGTGDSGIVDRGVQPTPAGHHCVDRRLHGRQVGDVGDQGPGRPAACYPPEP